MNEFQPVTMQEAQDMLDKVRFLDEIDLEEELKQSAPGDFEIVDRFHDEQVSSILDYVRNVLHHPDDLPVANSLPRRKTLSTWPVLIGTSEDCGPGTFFNELLESRRS